MATVTPEEIVYDIRGQICPSSLLTTLKEINRRRRELGSGTVSIEIKTDNRNATATIPTTACNMGYDARVIKAEGYYRIIISQRK